jgi:hypothetical protein
MILLALSICLVCILFIPIRQVLVLWLTKLGQHLFNQVLGAENGVEHIGSITFNWHLVLVIGVFVACIDLIKSFLMLASLRHLHCWGISYTNFRKNTHSIACNWFAVLLHWLSLSNVWLPSGRIITTKDIDILLIGRYGLIEVIHIGIKLIFIIGLSNLHVAGTSCFILVIVQIRIWSFSRDLR